MGNVQFTKNELRLKSWLGLPSWVLTFFLALVLGGGDWLLYLGILALGWYLYTLLYWKLYQRLMLNRSPKQTGAFYGLLVGYQFAVVGVVVLFLVQI